LLCPEEVRKSDSNNASSEETTQGNLRFPQTQNHGERSTSGQNDAWGGRKNWFAISRLEGEPGASDAEAAMFALRHRNRNEKRT